MQFNTLENLSILELTALFNRAFADYFVKIELTKEILQEKIDSEDIQLDKSVGLFSNGVAVGFILHAVRNAIAYNAGTGVIPEFREKNATTKMYDFILPKLKQKGISEVVLEVMAQNIPAIKSYNKVGFKNTLNLECFKGKPNLKKINRAIFIQDIKELDFKLTEQFRDWQPTWQHADETIKKSASYKAFGAFINETLCAYMIANPDSGRVAQFAVNRSYRNQGAGSALFHHLSNLFEGELSVINVDGIHSETHAFLQKLGLEHFLTQYKMTLNLN